MLSICKRLLIDIDLYGPTGLRRRAMGPELWYRDAFRCLTHRAAVIQKHHKRIAVRLGEHAGGRHEVLCVSATEVQRDLDDG